MTGFKPIPGNVLFDALKDEEMIVIANNARFVPGVAKGIFRAAKDADAAIMFEIARSESDLKGGYTGMTPKDYAEKVMEAANDVGHDVWALHADHITVKRGDAEDVENTKKLIDAQIEAGFTSFAIDASYLFDMGAEKVEDQLKKNIEVTTELAKHIEKKMGGKPFGLEAEVGEIGKKNKDGLVHTTPEEAVAYIKALNENGVKPNVLAIANGTIHGNVYDAHGNPIEQVSINIPQTVKVADALKAAGLGVRIAQHGITGTPRELIKTKFPKASISKGNVATFWQNLTWDVLKICKPELYNEIFEWVITTHKEAAEKKGLKKPGQVFGIFSKKAFGARDKDGKFIFFDRLNSLEKGVVDKIEALTYAEALLFLDSFNADGSAEVVRKKL